MNPIILVGQGPNQTSWKNALEKARARGLDESASTRWAEEWCARVAMTGRVGETLARLAGVERLTFYRQCVRLNLNARWNGKSGKGDAFDAEEGRRKAAEIILTRPDGKVLLVGKHVALCFGLKGEFFTEAYSAGKHFLVFPHPSGINRWWNEPGNAKRAIKALRRFLRGN